MQPTPSAPPSQAFAAVFGSGPGGSFLTVVAADGTISAQVPAQSRAGDFSGQPWASASGTAVYYLAGDAALMRLRPGGSPDHVRDLPGTPSKHAVFAVSADDRRVAVALLTYGPTPTDQGLATANYQGMTMYVEDVSGGNHVDVFSSATAAEWPIGWRGTDLVIAVGSPQTPGLGLNPLPNYAFNGIRVVDAATGARKVALCEGSPALGVATTGGIICALPGGTAIVDWSGHNSPIGESCTTALLQPDGNSVACAGFPGNFIISGGSRRTLPAAPLAWIGSGHLLLGSPAGRLLYELSSGTARSLDLLATFQLAAIPGGL